MLRGDVRGELYNSIVKVLFAAQLGLFCGWALFGCESEPDNLTTTPTPPVGVPPEIGKPLPDGSVTTSTSTLLENPQPGPCPEWGPPSGQGWLQIFRHSYPSLVEDAQPENCLQLPPNSTYPNLSDSGHVYPSYYGVNDNIRSFFAFVQSGNCVRLTFKEHPDWYLNGGASLTYQACATGGNNAYLSKADLQADAGFNFQVTQVRVDWWTQ